MNVEAFAQAHGMNPTAVAGLVAYLQRTLERSEAAREAFKIDADAFIAEGVKAYTAQVTAYYTELLEGKTERAKAHRDQIAAEVWTEARKRAGLPV